MSDRNPFAFLKEFFDYVFDKFLLRGWVLNLLLKMDRLNLGQLEN